MVTLGSLRRRGTRGLALLSTVALTCAALAGPYLAAPPVVRASSADHLGIAQYGHVAPVAGSPWEFYVAARTSLNFYEDCFDDTVHFAYTDALTSMPADYQFHRGNPGCSDGGDGGFHRFVIVPHVSGTQTITVSDVTHPGLQTSMTIEVAPGAASSLSINLPANSTLGAGTHFLVTAHDAYGNDATGYVGTVGFTSTDPLAVFEYLNYAFNGGDAGSRMFLVTFHSSGSQSVTATDVGNASITASASTTVGIAAYFDVELASTADAGNPPDCSVTAMKLDGTPDTSYAGTVHLTSSDPIADLPSDHTFNSTDGGTLLCTSYVTFKTARTQTLTATDVAFPTINGTDTTYVLGGDAAAISVIGLSQTTIAGPVNVTVILSDAYGNRAGSGWIYFSSTDPNAILPAAFPYAWSDYGNHNFTVTLETPGPVTLTVSGCYVPQCSATAATTVYPGPATRLVVSGLSSPRTAGVAGTLTVRAADAYGNTDSSYHGTIHFTSSDPAAVLPANYTFLTSEHGVHVFSSAVTLKTVGTQSVTATDTVTSSINGSQTGIVVAAVPGAPTGAHATPGNASALVSWSAPAANGSAITGYTVTSSVGAKHCTTSGTLSCTVTGLTNGTPYTFTVTATNGVGTGPASAASNSVTPAAVPGAPTGAHATAGNTSALVSWVAPASNGGSAITGYTVTSSPGAKHCTTSGTLSCTVTGLTNGTPYTFTVTATNVIGTGPASAASNSVTPAAVPGAPTGAHATAGNTSALVSWVAPASNGSAITGYTVTSSSGAKHCTTSGTLSCTVTGLTNGTPYTFTVTATNGVGTGPASAASNSVTPAAVPGAPTGAHATAGNTSALVSWVAPASNGGSAITGYTVTSSPGAKHCTTSGTLSCTVTGLTNGTPYTFTVTATNGVGTGPASAASNSVTPAAVPGAPTGAHATAGNTSALVSWVAPASNGGSAITGYTVTSSPGAKHCTTSGTLSCTVTGLTNGTPYTFTVTATNVIGTGPASAASNSVTPAAVPGAPTGAHATAGNTSALVSWSAPAANGSAITGYTVTSSVGAKHCTTSGTLSCTVTGLTNGTPYTFTVTATNGVGTGPASDPSAAVTPFSGATYHALTPTRILDSRDGTGGLSGAFSSHVARTFGVRGHGGVPANAIAVTGNLTVTGQTSLGFLFIGPNAMNNPTSSTLNFPLADDRANAVTVALSGTGTLSITYAAPTLGKTAHVIFDVTGYFTPDMSGATYHALTPTRILDSRDGTGGLSGAFSSHVARTFAVTGHGGVPTNAIAVTGNLTVTGQTSLGFLFIGPIAMNNPTSSTLNFPLADDRANAVTVALSGTGTLSITYAAPTLGKTAHVIFDVTGYFTPDMSGATYHALTPTRILDSRDGTGGLSGAFSSHVARTFQVTGHGGVPTNAIAVTGNLTVTGQTSLGFLFIGPIAMNNPTSSTLNFPLADDRANAVTVALSGTGTLSITYAAPTPGKTAHVIFDVTGYFTP